MTHTGQQKIRAVSRRLPENDIFDSMPRPWIKKNIWSFISTFVLVHRSLIKNRTQTAVIDILFECSHFYRLINKLIKIQLFTADIDIKSWCKVLYKQCFFYLTMIICFARC